MGTGFILRGAGVDRCGPHGDHHRSLGILQRLSCVHPESSFGMVEIDSYVAGGYSFHLDDACFSQGMEETTRTARAIAVDNYPWRGVFWSSAGWRDPGGTGLPISSRIFAPNYNDRVVGFACAPCLHFGGDCH